MRRRGRWIAAVVAAAWACAAAGCVPPRGGSTSHATDAAAPSGARAKTAARAAAPAAKPVDLAGMEREIVARVNRYRRSEGLPALANDARIAEIARRHSRDMANGRRGFGHGGFAERTKTVAGKVAYRRVAENVARHRRRARSEIPGVAVDGWVGSRGHRHNIEGPFAITGVGAAVAKDGTIYLTQIFVAPR